MTIDYTPFCPYSREEIIAQLATVLSPKRLAHVLRVEEQAIALAEQYHVPVAQASLAALLHDYAREMPVSAFEPWLSDADRQHQVASFGRELLHGYVGWRMIQDTFKVTDGEILQSIAVHTIGGVDMSPLNLVLFVADYIEPGRHFPGVDEARRLAASDLRLAAQYKILQTMSYLVSQRLPLFSEAVKVYNAWLPSK